MLVGLKRKIQQHMVERRYKTYCRKLWEKRNLYDAYLAKEEGRLKEEYGKRTCKLTSKIVTLEELPFVWANMEKCSEDILVVAGKKGILNPLALPAILSEFEEHSEWIALYADEDVCVGTQEDFAEYRKKGAVKRSARCNPFMKPFFSPETLLSFPYWGNVWAMRMSIVREIHPLPFEDAEVFAYDVILKTAKLAKKNQIGHLEEILFHKFEEIRRQEDGSFFSVEEMEKALQREDCFYGYEPKFDKIKEDFCKSQGIEVRILRDNTDSGIQPGVFVYERKEQPLVSIIIPSKDNPKILRQCISSIYEKSSYDNFEIIVVDNGSSEENKAEIQKLREQYPFTYLYNPMPFNYSAMNNMGAQKARGEVLLLLNDDMEVCTSDWLERMTGQLMQEGIGAVGAKLLYPNSTLIQHVGVTNAIDGPVHKLIKKEDTLSYNHGRNKLIYNVLGVTGACLMVRKAEYEALGGLQEELKVAYNDVDLCFSLHEKGLRNVIRNDVILYHHESLSRGADSHSEEKMLRLKWERDYLYSRHPFLYGKDPYEGANNSGGADFGIRMEPNYTNAGNHKVSLTRTDYRKYPAGVCVKIDRAEKELYAPREYGDIYVVEGYAVLPEADNCRYDFEMVLCGETENYAVKMEKQLRPNLSAGFPNATNLELSGFCQWIKKDELPTGKYIIGIYAKDRCSRQKLFQDTGVCLNVN